MNSFRLILVALALPMLAAAAPSPAPETTLFAFDDHGLPFQTGLRLQLVPFQLSTSKPHNQVLLAGLPGAPDSLGCYYYGTVREVNGEWWMWYYGIGDHDPKPPVDYLRLCLAKSQDGRHWNRPALGLVEYAGTKANNLVSLDGGDFRGQGCCVLYEPDDPDPARRFKMVFETARYKQQLAVAFSADGVRWTEEAGNPQGPYCEPSGLVKWHGAYYLATHARGYYYPAGAWARTLDTFVSYDFAHWMPTPALGFRRDPVPPRPIVSTDPEQVHMGAGLWDRGNVIIGFYGQWHGTPTNDRTLVSMDLGLVISHDALHYEEPIPDFRIVAAKETVYAWPREAFLENPAIMQGQGFANIGDESLFWYCSWNLPAEGIRVASWQRDRLGYLQPIAAGPTPPNAVSAPIDTGGRPMAVSLNVAGLNDLSKVKVSILDERFKPLPGFGESDCTGPTGEGLRQRVTWKGSDRVTAAGPIRIRVDFEGVRPEDIRLYTVYVTPQD